MLVDQLLVDQISRASGEQIGPNDEFLQISGFHTNSARHLEMADIASETALQHLKSLYPYGEFTSSSDGNSYSTLVMGIRTQCDIVIQNPWYIVALVSFTFGNIPEAVPLLFKYVLRELEHAQNQFQVPALEAEREKLLLARKFRDAIFKGGMVGGYSKVHTPCYHK